MKANTKKLGSIIIFLLAVVYILGRTAVSSQQIRTAKSRESPAEIDPELKNILRLAGAATYTKQINCIELGAGSMTVAFRASGNGIVGDVSLDYQEDSVALCADKVFQVSLILEENNTARIMPAGGTTKSLASCPIGCTHFTHLPKDGFTIKETTVADGNAEISTLYIPSFTPLPR